MYEQEQSKMQAARAVETRYGAGAQNAVPTPKEPGITDRLKELSGYLQEMAEIQQEQRGVLFRPEPCDPSGNTKLASDSIEELAAICCERAAMLVGEARSIRRRL